MRAHSPPLMMLLLLMPWGWWLHAGHAAVTRGHGTARIGAETWDGPHGREDESRSGDDGAKARDGGDDVAVETHGGSRGADVSHRGDDPEAWAAVSRRGDSIEGGDESRPDTARTRGVSRGEDSLGTRDGAHARRVRGGMAGHVPYRGHLPLDRAHGAHKGHGNATSPVVVLPEYMVSLYRTLSVAENLGLNGSLSRKGTDANTVTGFVDKGHGALSPALTQRYVFDVSALSAHDSLVDVELRLLRRPPEASRRDLSRGGLYHVSVWGCGADPASPYRGDGGGGGGAPLDSRTIDVLDWQYPRWEVFDVRRSLLMGQGGFGGGGGGAGGGAGGAGGGAHRSATELCLELEAVSDRSSARVDVAELGFSRQGRDAERSALLVVFSRGLRRTDNLFSKIREKIKPSRRQQQQHNNNRQKDHHHHHHQQQHQQHQHQQQQHSNNRQQHLRHHPHHHHHRQHATDEANARARRGRRMTVPGRGGGGGGGGGASPKGGGASQASPGGVPARRSSSSSSSSRSRCGRRQLRVNFKELGWDDWIIAPLDYDAYLCEGVCDFPLRSHLEPTNHAIIQTLLNSLEPDATPPSCCVPTKLSPISILYIDAGNNVVYKQYEGMVVEACGCR
ncbi:growth/differentiation factor 6-A-like [Lampetra planeri]